MFFQRQNLFDVRKVAVALSLLASPLLQLSSFAALSDAEQQNSAQTEGTVPSSASTALSPAPGSSQAPASVPVPSLAPVSSYVTAPSGQTPQVSVVKASQPAPPFPVAGKLSRAIQSVTGINLLGTLIADGVATAIAKKKLGGHVKVRIKVFSLTDLIAGKVKSISVSTADGSVKGVPIGAAKISSSGPIWFNLRRHTQQAYGLATPVSLNVSGQLQQKDVCSALESDTVTRAMRGLKLDLPGLGDQQLKMLSPKVTLADGNITIQTTLICEGADPDTGVNLSIKAKPVLVGSKVMLENMEVSSPDIEDPASFSKFTHDLFNPIVDFARFDRTTHAFRPNKCCIEGNLVSLSGNLLLVPKGYLAQKAVVSTKTPPQ